MTSEFKKLEVFLSWDTRSDDDAVRVGLLADFRGDVRFEYDAAFADGGLELSPFRLPLSRDTWKGDPRLFDGLPGVFDDSLPDGWGRLLIDREFRRAGHEPTALSPLDRLAYLGDRTMGALTYRPPAAEFAGETRALDLDALARDSELVLRGDAGDVLDELVRLGGSSGGARPKVLVGVANDNEFITGDGPLPAGFEPWIVKFRSRGDGRELGAIEYAYSRMAREAGLEMTDCRLIETPGGNRFFATRRFDRPGDGRRVHMHTLGNLVHRDFRQPAFDYEHLLRVASALTRRRADVLRCYRQLVFNVLTWNRDDHAKNFSFVLTPDGEWRASPAYDLVFSEGYREQHFTAIAGEGRAPHRGHLNQLAALVDIPPKERARVEDEVRAAVARWPALAREQDIPKKAVTRVRGYHHRAWQAFTDGPAYA